MTILVTGGAGFIGSHLCERLLAQGHRVFSIDNLDRGYPSGIKKKNIAAIQSHPHSKYFRSACLDIRDPRQVERFFRAARPDLVVHLAAKVGVRPSLRHSKLYEEVNVGGTRILLEACRKNGVRKFIFASSSSIYGNAANTPFKESQAELKPISPYAVTKKAGETLCRAYARAYGMDICALRFFTVYGPRQRPDLAIHKFTRLLLEGRPIPFYGNGGTCRDYTFVGDIVQGVSGAIRWISRGKPSGRFEIFNLGGSQPVSLRTLIQRIEKIAGRRARLQKMPEQPGDVRRTCASISKAKRILGYHPKTDLESGLRLFMDWYRTVSLPRG